MKRAIITLTMRVVYHKEDGSDISSQELHQLRKNLDYLPRYAAGMGALTDDAADVVVDTWDHDTTIPTEVT